MEVVDYTSINSELSPNQSPLSTSPSPEQRDSPRGSMGMINEQSLHIIVEPQLDGQRNAIYLMNPTGEIISTGIAEHGAHIEIQPGVIFRVPFPHEHQPYSTPMQPQHLQPQHLQPQSAFHSTYPPTIPQSGHSNNTPQMIIPTQYQPEMINATCPMHGSPQSNGNVHSGNDRLDKTRQKLQKKLRGKNSNVIHCTCTYKPYNSPYNYDSLYMDKKMMHLPDDTGEILLTFTIKNYI